MKISFQNENVTLWHGDCREWSGKADAVVSDPPYGMGWEGNQRFSGGNTRRGLGTRHAPIHGDLDEFDPAPWLDFPAVVLWGANHFWNRLPPAAALIWQKRNEHALGTFLSDAEIAFMNVGCGVYVCRKVFAGSSRAIDGDVGAYDGSLHPNQKPTMLMKWCMERAKVAPGATVLDPYAGSGTTLIAALETGRKAIGIEIDERWVEVAHRRLERWHAQGRLDFGTANGKDDTPK